MTRHTRNLALVGLSLLMVLLAGCAAVGPDYRPPEVLAPGQWNAGMEDGLTAKDPGSEIASWWSTLNDPVLAALIEQAREGNLDTRQAVSRIRQARANLGISRAGFFPVVDASGARTYSRSSEDTGSGEKSDFYSVGFDASWELDIFGGTRRAVEAAGAELEATEEELRDVLVTLFSEVALSYVDFRAFQTRLAVAEANLKLQEETYDLTEARFDAGLTSRLDVDQARANLENTRARIPSLQTGVEGARNRISVLLGKNPGALDETLSQEAPIPVAPIETAVGVPAEVLRRRPDIRRAERQLAAQTARVGVATADLYPRFQLPGSIGLEALSLDNLFLAGSHSYRYGFSFSWPIFTGGRIRNTIKIENELTEQALLGYESAVLTALEEVENALVAYAKEQARLRAITEAAQAARRAADLAETQYASGLVDFEVVLDAQRTLLSFEEQMVISQGEVASNLIRLYKALGGGWQSMAATQT